METRDPEYLKNHEKTKKRLKIVGWILLPIGIALMIVCISSFITWHTELFFWGFLGLPLIFVAIICLSTGYMHEIQSYTASQSAPVQKDYVNYMLDGTREELGKTVQSFTSSGDCPKKICRSCGKENAPDAQFCSYCGKPIARICPTCGKQNEADARYCQHCGNRIDA